MKKIRLGFVVAMSPTFITLLAMHLCMNTAIAGESDKYVGHYIIDSNGNRVPLTEQNMPQWMRQRMAKEKAEQDEFDNVCRRVEGLRKNLYVGGKIITHANVMTFIQHNKFFIDLGASGNSLGVGRAVFEYERAASFCYSTCSKSVKEKGVVPLAVYRQMFKCYGKAMAARYIVDEVESFWESRRFANERMRIINRELDWLFNARKPEGIAKQDFRNWIGQGYRELLQDWDRAVKKGGN